MNSPAKTDGSWLMRRLYWHRRAYNLFNGIIFSYCKGDAGVAACVPQSAEKPPPQRKWVKGIALVRVQG